MLANSNQRSSHFSHYYNILKDPQDPQVVELVRFSQSTPPKFLDKAFSQALFLNTLPVTVDAGAVVLAAAVFFDTPPVTPLLIEPITDFFVFVGGAISLSAAVSAPFFVPFFTTVDVLLSLDSDMILALRAGLVSEALLDVPAPVATAAFLPLADPAAELAVVDVEAVCFRGDAPGRVDRAFSAKLLKRLDTLLCFTGDEPATVLKPERDTSDLPPGVVRGKVRTLAEDGDSTLDLLVASASGAGWPRCFFLTGSESIALPRFSLSVCEASSLSAALAWMRTREERRVPYLICLGGRPDPDLDDDIVYEVAFEVWRATGVSFSGTGGGRETEAENAEGAGLDC